MVEHRFMYNLIVSNIIANYIQENKLFLIIVCDLFARFKGCYENLISVEIFCQYYGFC